MKKRFCCALVVMMCLAAMLPAFGAEPTSEELSGQSKDGLYTNYIMGAQAYFGDYWYILSREEIAAVMGLNRALSPTIDELTDGQTPVFYVISNDGKTNINITITDFGIPAEAALSDPSSMEGFLDLIMKLMSEQMSKAYSEMGAKDFNLKRENFKFMGSTIPGMVITFKDANSEDTYQKMAMCVKGRYCFLVTATSTNYDITDILLSMFRKID